MFVVVIPTWEGAECWMSLRNSDLCRRHLQLPAGEHGYCEGAQHNRCNPLLHGVVLARTPSKATRTLCGPAVTAEQHDQM